MIRLRHLAGALALLLATLGRADAQVLVEWDFTSATNPATPGNPVAVGVGAALLPASAATTAAGVQCSDLVARSRWEGHPCNPSGLQHSPGNVVPSGELNLQKWDGDVLTSCGADHDGVNDNYLEFVVTPTAGPIDVGRVSISTWRNGTGAPAAYAFEVVVDGGTPVMFGAAALDNVQGDGGFDWFHFDAYAHVTSSLVVRFRPAAAPGGQGTGNLHIDGLRVEGGDPPAAAGPRVLFLIADDLGAQALEVYGNADVHTPNLNALAARGVVFDRAYTQFPVCDASRSSMLTGWYPHRIVAQGGGFSQFDAALGDHVTLPEHFHRSGFDASRVSKLYHMRIPGDITAGASGPDHAPSWTWTHDVQAPEQHSIGVAGHYTNETLNFGQNYSNGFGAAFYTVATTTDGSEQADYLAATAANQRMAALQHTPFFLGVGLVRPHVPLVAPQSYFDLYDPLLLTLAQSVPNDLFDIPAVGIFWNEASRGPNTDADRRAVLQAYYAAVTFMDEQVGRVLAQLDALGLADETYVVFTADHGYHLGEHTQWQKLSLHEESARVPLIIAGPGIAAGRTGALAEQVDLYPTLCDLTGLEVPERCQGVSLAPVLLDGAPRVRESALTQVTQGSNGHLLRTEEWAYLRYSNGYEELYDMRDASQGGDPKQFTNVAHDANFAATKAALYAELQRRLVDALGDPGIPFCAGDGNPLVCPCGNESDPVDRAGCLNSTGVGGRLSVTGTAVVAAGDLVLHLEGAVPGQPGMFVQGATRVAVPFRDGVLCMGNPTERLEVVFTDVAGAGTSAANVAATGAAAPGATRYYQAWYRDPGGVSPCGSGSNFSNGVVVDWR